MRLLLPLVAALGLSACATQFDTPSTLSRTDMMQPGERRLVAVREYADGERLAGLTRLVVPAAEFAPGVAQQAGVADDRGERIRTRVSRALCRRLARAGYEVITEADGVTPLVQARITGVRRNNIATTGASRAIGVAVPGPLNPRVPLGIGALGAEAEIIAADGTQIAAMRWASSNHLVSGGGWSTLLDGRDGFSDIADAIELSDVFADAFGDLVVESRGENEERGETPFGACRVYDEIIEEQLPAASGTYQAGR